MEQSVKKLTGRHEAFTRVDLVVVVAMTGLLLLIAFSAYAKPRNRVYQVTDENNLRQTMLAMNMYSSDNSGIMPDPGWGLGPYLTKKCWAFEVPFPTSPGSGNTSVNTYLTYLSAQLAAVTNGMLFPYLHDSKVFMCPADRPDSPAFWDREIYISSYVWNGAVVSYGATKNLIPNKLSAFRPDAILQWERDEQNPQIFNDLSDYPNEAFPFNISQRHGTETPVGMFGGGVATISLTDFDTMATASTANRLWCSPS